MLERQASADALLESAAALLSGPLLAPWPRKETELGMIARTREQLAGRFVLAVVGEFSSGKSFLLNALLGTVNRTGDRLGGLLAVDINPSTATITELRYGSHTRATAYFGSGREERIPIEGLGRFVAVAKDARGALHGALDDDDAAPSRVVVEVDSPFLESGFLLADTPGLASLNPAHRRATLGFLPRADAVLYLVDTQQPFTEGDAAFLGLIEEYVKVIFIVQTKIDLRREPLADGREEWELARKRISDRARQNAPDAEILAVSAREYALGLLDGDGALRERSGIPALVAQLGRSLEGRVQKSRNARARTLVRYVAGQARARTALEAELGRLDGAALHARYTEAIDRLEDRELVFLAEIDALRAGASHADRTCATLGRELAETLGKSVARAFDITDISRLRDRGKLHMLVDALASQVFGAFAAAVAAEVTGDFETLVRDRADLAVAERMARAFGGEIGSGAWSRDLPAGIRATIVLNGIGGPVLPLIESIAAAFAAHRPGEYMKRELSIDVRETFLPELAGRIDRFVAGVREQIGGLYGDVEAAIDRDRLYVRAETVEPIERAIERNGDPVRVEEHSAQQAAALAEIEVLLSRAQEAATPQPDADLPAVEASRPIDLAAFDADAYQSGLRPQRYRVVILGALDRGKSSLINAIAETRLLQDGGETDARFPIHVRYGAERRAYALVREGAWHDIGLDAAMVQASRTPVLIEIPWTLPRELVLVHAPAFDSGEPGAEAIAIAAAANASEIVLLFSRQLSDREVTVLEQVRAFSRPLVLAHTMADTESASERRTVVELANRVVAERGIDVQRVFTISGYDALEAASASRPPAAWNELYALRETLAAHAEEHMARLAKREREKAAAKRPPDVRSAPAGLGGSLARIFGKRGGR